MTPLTCRFGLMHPFAALPYWIGAGAPDIVEAFRAGSGGSIGLAIDTTGLASPAMPQVRPVGSYDLHAALRQLIGSPRKPVDTVGVLFCGQYKYESIFGIMFDTDFDLDVESEGNAPGLAGPPREGCAIFLDTIAERRAAGREYEAQAQFTTTHEIGHLFNLQHEAYEPCYLRESGASQTYGEGYWRFTDGEKVMLAKGVSDDHVWPGGSCFQDLGYNADTPCGAAASRRAPVTLKIGLPRERFHHFEPIELDIEVALHPDLVRPVQIPDVIDPGYRCFRVWIEEPTGERRLFRSPRHYCGAGGMRRIGRSSPFRRDISLFGESGGYTFRRCGQHSAWTELLLPGCAPVLSNKLSFDVAPIRSQAEIATAALLSQPSVRTVLYHRIDRHRGAGLRRLRDWLASRRSHPSAAAARYAMARAMLERSHHARGDAARVLTRRARGLLQAVTDADAMGRHQRRIARTLLSETR